MKNKELAEIFAEIADALEFKGDNRFKIIAYRKASDVLNDLTDDVYVLARRRRLQEIPGIGEGIAKKIEEYLNTGRIRKHEEALSEIPRDLLKLLKVQNLGPKTLALVHEKLGVENLDDLKRVIQDGSLASLFRMGEQRVNNIKKSIEVFLQTRERIPLYEALETSDEIVNYLKTCPEIEQVAPAGSLRRMRATVGDIDILATAREGAKIIDFFTGYPKADRILASGKTKGSILVRTGRDVRQVDLRIVPSDSYGAALQYFTGCKAHNVRLRGLAKEKGLKISEYGVFRGSEKIAGRNEEEVYKAVGLPYIPPELRENRGELEAALEKKLPDLVKLSDIKGDLHVHSSYSDGLSTIKEIAQHAKALGYEYVAICDHSKSVRYAGGLNEDRLKKQMREIEKLNEEVEGVRILKGVEVDILGDGALDLDLGLLEQLDIVVAAIHTGFKRNVTQRIVKAIESPFVDIIAHPTGRLISGREGYEVDIDKVMEKAGENKKMLELNAYPDRLDLNDLQLLKAKDMGVKISIGTDAHSVADMRWMQLGIGTARRGWLERKDIVNTMSFLEMFGK
ncbi:MAG: DNA polymerase/3'-5' exonuclease PolX [Candidatus Bathyarchaeota archaeon]|jgi:DNA polymerase (family 10)